MNRPTIVTAAAAFLVNVVAMNPAANAQKKNTSTNWPCRAQMRDAGTDAIRSDGRVNADGTTDYVHGVAGVTCVVVPPDSGLITAGDLSLYFASNTRRALFYAEQNGGVYPGYDAFYDKGSIRVKQITGVAGAAEARAFIAYSGAGRFLATNAGEGDTIVDLVSVEALDGCTWRITFDPTGAAPNGSALMELWDSPGWDRFRGILQMPFGLTVRVTGGKAGCPA